MPDPIQARELADGKLLVDKPADGVARLTIRNPQKRNALDHPILDAIVAALAELGSTGADTRCVVITGADGMFSAGYEIGGITDGAFEQEAERLVAHPFTEAIEALEAFPYPTLAALPGHTIGGGLELALACDLRVACAELKLGMPPGKLGLVYSHTGLRRFIDTIGVARTRELFLLGNYIDADTALRWGLVQPNCAEPRVRECHASHGRRIGGQRTARADRQQACDRGVAECTGGAIPRCGGRADRVAPGVVCLTGLARGHESVRREALAPLERQVIPHRQPWWRS